MTEAAVGSSTTLLPSRPAEPVPIFIGGAQRSGTTLLRTMLDTHSRIAAGPELHLAEALAAPGRGRWSRLEQRLRRYPWWSNIELPAPPLDTASRRRLAEELRDAYLAHTGKTRWVEKTPSNVLHLRVIEDLFPQARFIICVRDGRDTVCSLVAAPWYRPRFAPRMLAATAAWVRAIAAGRRAQSRLGERCLHVRYETLVHEPERTLRRVLEFLGEPWEPRVLEFDRHPHDWTVGGQRLESPLSTASIGRWRTEMTLRQRLLFRLVAGRALASLGYRWDDADPVDGS